jgi:hypothetical protein
MCEVSSCQHSAYLTDIRRNDSAGFGLRVERVPVAYQRKHKSEMNFQKISNTYPTIVALAMVVSSLTAPLGLVLCCMSFNSILKCSLSHFEEQSEFPEIIRHTGSLHESVVSI